MCRSPSSTLDNSVKATDDLPRLLRRLGIIDQIKMLVGNHAFVGKELEVDDRVPILPPEQDDWKFLHALCLSQRQRVEQFIERAESPGKDNECFGSQQEVHLAQREVMELKAQLGRTIQIGTGLFSFTAIMVELQSGITFAPNTSLEIWRQKDSMST